METAFEFQGVQHYEPINFFGGEDGLRKRERLDIQKKEKSIENGVKLIEWQYDEPLSKITLYNKLS
jgi:hypothetical protein